MDRPKRVFNQLDNISSSRPTKRQYDPSNSSSSSSRTESDCVDLTSDDDEIRIVTTVSSRNNRQPPKPDVQFSFLKGSMPSRSFSSNKHSTEYRLNPEFLAKTTYKIKPTVSISSQEMCEKPGPIDGKEEYEVEKIITYTKHGKEKFLIKWKGWTYNDSSWEPRTSLSCPEILKHFLIRLRVMEKIYKMCQPAECIYYPYDPMRPLARINNLLALSAWEDQLNKVCRDAGIAPIFVENWIDDELAPEDFRFSQSNIFHESAKRLLKPMKTQYRCSCNGRTYCNRNSCCASKGKLRFPYHKNRLTNDTQKIIECYDECSCDINCPARLVQQGRQIPLVLFKTQKCGWSIKTASYISQGTFVMAYTGEVIDKKLDRHDERYLYDIDCANIDEVTFSVDSLHYGNEARWVNHCCEPNLKTFGVTIDRYENYETLAFFAIKDIQAGEELTIDYNAQLHSKEMLIDGYDCHCGAKKCRRFLMD